MSIGKKQLQRLLKIAAQLKENRYPNCNTLVEDFRRLDIENNMNIACSSKTIRRDMKVLQDDFNCPVEFDWGKNGYYLKHHGWNFDCPALFEEHEMLAMVLGARLAEEIFPEPLKNNIRQVVDFQLTYNNPDFLDKAIINSLTVFPGLKTDINAEIFMTIFNCWQNHEVVEITYSNINDVESVREIEPHSLVYYGSSWYTKARCLLRDEIRSFAIHRIVAATEKERYFEPDSKIITDLNDDKFLDYDEVKDIKIICDNGIKNFIEATPLHKDQSTEKFNDEQILLTIPSMAEHELIQWTLYQAGMAEITAPIEMRQKVKEAAQEIMQKHKRKN
jgi:predicted DNA-binding transcriptional regulator YafY